MASLQLLPGLTMSREKEKEQLTETMDPIPANEI